MVNMLLTLVHPPQVGSPQKVLMSHSQIKMVLNTKTWAKIQHFACLMKQILLFL